MYTVSIHISAPGVMSAQHTGLHMDSCVDLRQLLNQTDVYVHM